MAAIGQSIEVALVFNRLDPRLFCVHKIFSWCISFAVQSDNRNVLFIDRSLGGRVVVVTGGSWGIGKAAVFRVAASGTITIIVARDAERLERTRQKAAARGLKLITYSADIADPAQCEATSIARGRRWLDELISNSAATTENIAEREGCSVRKINMTISLAFLAPNLVKVAIEGRLPHGMGLVRLCDRPVEWSRQHQALGLASQ